ncbi:hypothetical protein BCR33DRAFT_713298 [Rhizoclosmatium globosum]|uniref:Uncharacterized protein n=1 Tax=Rhizoclosmatium globosum TaxID=329046 RepID=A0A1Y2CU11_9FUNG|nr:hypothetical protein BCR33DRAFT_713298 [Rhizoclosmatium globosum]|eukprot:ORY50513.1 hypothetical protein BCR33DRAFT_713298 [Rhizoclosmatium globosum]
MKTPSDNLEILKSNETKLPIHLQNKLILLIGDSYERNLVRDICELTGREARAATLNGTLFTNNQGYSGSTYVCTITKDSASFVLVSVFHVGVLDPMINAKKYPDHWQPDSPTDLPDRISWIPHMLKSLAKELYPALCPRLNDGITIDASACPNSTSIDKSAILAASIIQPPLWKNETSFWYPIPDMIVAQSSAWDLKTMKHSNEALSNWANAVSRFLISPVLEQFGSVVKDSFEFNHDVVQWHPRLFLRTLPMVQPFMQDKTFESKRLHKLNNLVRSGVFFDLERKRFGVLDWDSLTTGLNDWYIDGFHPGPEPNKAYLQMLLARLEGLHHRKIKPVVFIC